MSEGQSDALPYPPAGEGWRAARALIQLTPFLAHEGAEMLNARMRLRSLVERTASAIEAWLAPAAPDDYGYVTVRIADDPYSITNVKRTWDL
jgi:hypothetical protein